MMRRVSFGWMRDYLSTVLLFFLVAAAAKPKDNDHLKPGAIRDMRFPVIQATIGSNFYSTLIT
jgi:hypothetical protein